mgnify:FL=1
MTYIDDQMAGPNPRPKHINLNRPGLRRNGQENSANGTGPEKTCKRHGGTSGAFLCCIAFAGSRSNSIHRASSVPHPDRASYGASGGKDRRCSTAKRYPKGLM